MNRFLQLMLALSFSSAYACTEWNDYSVQSEWTADAPQFYNSPEFNQAPVCYSGSACSCLCDAIQYDKLHFYGEFLYFRPTLDHSHYITTTSFSDITPPDITIRAKRHRNTSDYKPAFRVGLQYDLCDCDNQLDARFTYLNAGHSNRTDLPILPILSTVPSDTPALARYRQKDRFEYYAGDLNLTKVRTCCLPDNLSFFAGLHYAFIKHHGHFDFNTIVPGSTLLNTKNQSTFWGIGPQVGVNYHYQYCNLECLRGNVGLFIEAKGALLCSRTKIRARSSIIVPGALIESVRTHSDDLVRVTPMADARIGAHCDFDVFCMKGSLEIGYEFQFYSKAVNTFRTTESTPTDDIYSNFSLQGPFVALNVAF